MNKKKVAIGVIGYIGVLIGSYFAGKYVGKYIQSAMNEEVE